MTATSATPAPQADSRAAGWGQSLADGAPGIALPHIERARAGTGGWAPVHHLATAMTREPVHAHPDTASLFRGAPAVAYALHTAGHPAYRTALATLDRAITTHIQVRLHTARQRMDGGQPPQAREYDLINGITGLGAYLLHRHHAHPLLPEVLTYLVRLTHPLRVGHETLPGWWTTGSPDRRRSPRWDGGHGNFGMAHGIAGPLALLSTTMRHGVTVPGHHDAIHTISAWLDQWRTGHDRHTWWPEAIDRHELRAGAVTHTGPHRPSWCYGTPGLARAQQLAGLAIGNEHQVRTAEQALIGCLTDDRQLAQLTDAGLCHGWAGLVHTAHRATTDTRNPQLAAATTAAITLLRHHVRDHGSPAGNGLLEGTAGIDLATTPGHETTSAAPSGWDDCLLLG